MRKIQLAVESLNVESFATDARETRSGTVQAHITENDFCLSANDAATCARRRTDQASCEVYCECTDRRVRCHDPIPIIP
ncbi:MAG TPA: hypothetical protein VFQ39_09825 [Longimicrobium sp.]|nr:hypothetical protein [Longimicrobium sp.]